MKNTTNMKSPIYYIYAILHILLILLIYTSPFILDLRIIGVGVVVYLLAGFFFKFCPLTKLQFGSTKHSFYWYYLNKLGIKTNEKKLNSFLEHVMPILVLLVAYIWQSLLGNRALI